MKLLKKYSAIEETIKYLTEKTGRKYTFDDIGDLEKEKKIKIYFRYKGVVTAIEKSGKNDNEIVEHEINIDCIYQRLDNELMIDPRSPYHIVGNYLEFTAYDVIQTYSDNAKHLNLKELIILNPFYYEEMLNPFFDYLRIETSNLEELVSSDDNEKDKKIINLIIKNDILKSELEQIKAQLDDQQQPPQRTRSQTDETNTDKKLIAMLAILLAKQSNTFRIGDRPNATQINEQVYNLTMQIVNELGMNDSDTLGLKANTDKISKAVQAYADMFKLSKD